MSNGTTSVFVEDADGKTKVRIDVPQEGQIGVKPTAAETIYLNGSMGEISLKIGGHERIVLSAFAPGGEFGGGSDIRLWSLTGRESIHLSADQASLILKHSTTETQTVSLDGNRASLTLGGSAEASPGQINLMAKGHRRIFLDSADANMYIGGHEMGGDLFLYPAGGNFSSGDGATTTPSIHLSGDKGDIVLANADCAEEFDVSPDASIEPGTVVVLDEEGKLRPSDAPYDCRVAGVVSGAGDFRPGIVLDKHGQRADRLPVSLTGKVYCKADARYAEIKVGDLLTTSPTLGHAMKALDSAKAFGAVIGKAMRRLSDGQGLIPILIALQ